LIDITYVWCRFSQWYNDVAGVNLNRVYSITLTNATQTDPNLYNYRSTAFYPINCQLWDSSINNCDPSVNFNSYFTYMINTYTTYNPGQQFTFRSSDDMWLFINGNLVPGWNLGGTSPHLTSPHLTSPHLTLLHLLAFALACLLPLASTLDSSKTNPMCCVLPRAVCCVQVCTASCRTP
jgi:hypothetical protein